MTLSFLVSAAYLRLAVVVVAENKEDDEEDDDEGDDKDDDEDEDMVDEAED